ncbi:hypothetical protein RO3G_15717 [Rhizopus delemar RA 99-880]|uniref:Uncharacterized protein n=1 Tax=Rhizopus delemar (strain RA 99-880 / ATCC MYA-4621 / FGSC 9543 / NRRL 43880) TaxID=246409 RepID=I1CRC6_RHIO9|nr:hypothetical protein RO3G_15717 [Rhizopus delemar RA 99-880]|eukprot:EIE91006.1 hypothetical protein RO3G_15717 [Rhizopus delemar RA 99-880]
MELFSNQSELKVNYIIGLDEQYKNFYTSVTILDLPNLQSNYENKPEYDDDEAVDENYLYEELDQLD